jgi:ferredoxin
MKIKQRTLMSFSPTGSTARILKSMTARFSYDVSILDLTPFQDPCRWTFTSQDLLLVGFPVFGGRVPPVLLDRLAYIRGQDTLAVIVAVYGNRHYDDALLEMADFLSDKGFIVMAGAAMVAAHSIVPSIAEGRPDAEDLAELDAFCDALSSQIHDLPSSLAYAPPQFPGNLPYKHFKGIPFKPQTSMACTYCGKCCSVCPTRAIPAENPDKTDKDKCITCMACVAACPEGARSIAKMDMMLTRQLIAKAAKLPKAPEFFRGRIKEETGRA